MGINNFEFYSKKVNQILDRFQILDLNEFCKSIEIESKLAESKGEKNEELDEIIAQIRKIHTTKEYENQATKEKVTFFLYQNAFKFLKTEKIKGDVPISQTFLSNMIAIAKDQ